MNHFIANFIKLYWIVSQCLLIKVCWANERWKVAGPCHPPFQLYSLFQPFARTGQCTQCTVVNDQSQMPTISQLHVHFSGGNILWTLAEFSFFWRQFSIERCSNLWGSLWLPIWYDMIRISTIWYDTIWINKIQYNWYDMIKELVQYDIWIGTIQDMNGYNTICKSVWYDIQIGTIRYSNQYDTIYKSIQYNIWISTIRYTNQCDMVSYWFVYHIVLICIFYRIYLYIVLYRFEYCIVLIVYRIVPICISYHTDSYIVSYRFVYRIVPILTPF